MFHMKKENQGKITVIVCVILNWEIQMKILKKFNNTFV